MVMVAAGIVTGPTATRPRNCCSLRHLVYPEIAIAWADSAYAETADVLASDAGRRKVGEAASQVGCRGLPPGVAVR